jgi:hypothetical protein
MHCWEPAEGIRNMIIGPNTCSCPPRPPNVFLAFSLAFERHVLPYGPRYALCLLIHPLRPPIAESVACSPLPSSEPERLVRLYALLPAVGLVQIPEAEQIHGVAQLVLIGEEFDGGCYREDDLGLC